MEWADVLQWIAIGLLWATFILRERANDAHRDLTDHIGDHLQALHRYVILTTHGSDAPEDAEDELQEHLH